MNIKKYKLFEEIAKSKGKDLLIEESFSDISVDNIITFDKSKLIESSDGNKYEARGILKSVPTARYNAKNANGRKYPEEIGVRIQKEKWAEGSDCYGNHAESEDSVFDVVGVWHNYTYKEGIGYADLYCIGDRGQLMLEKAKAGGKLGFSTVAYGSLMEDNETVDPNSFEIAPNHYCDWVCNPSAGVFGTYENIQESTEQTNILTESITNKIDENIDNSNKEAIEQKRNNEMSDKFMEATVKNQVRLAIKEAKSSTSIKEAIEDLKNTKTTIPSEMVESHDKLEEAIADLTAKLDEQVSHAKETLKEKESSLEEMTAKYQTAEKALTEMKENYKRMEAVVAKLKESDDKVQLIEALQKDSQLMKEDIKCLTEEISKRDKDIKIFIKERADMVDDLKIYESETKKLKESLGTCQLNVKSLKKKVKEDEEYSDIGAYGDGEVEDETFPAPDEDVLDVDLDTAEVIDAESTVEDIDSLGLDDDLDAEGLMNEEDESEDDEEDEKEMKEAEEDDKEDKKDKEDEKKDDEKEKKEESVKKTKVLKSVYKHYVESAKKKPILKKFQKDILSQPTLYDATLMIEKIIKKSAEKSEMISLRESGVKLQKVEEYKFTRQ